MLAGGTQRLGHLREKRTVSLGDDEHSNGHQFASKFEIERLDMRIDEQARIASRGLGEFIERWVKVESKLGDLSYEVGKMRSDVNNVGHKLQGLNERFESRMGSMEGAVAKLSSAVEKLLPMLTKLLPSEP